MGRWCVSVGRDFSCSQKRTTKYSKDTKGARKTGLPLSGLGYCISEPQRGTARMGVAGVHHALASVATLFSFLGFAGHGNEADADAAMAVDLAVLVTLDEEEFLVPLADGDDEFAARGELVDEGLGDVVGCGGDDDHVEGRFVGPALVAVAMADGDVLVAEVGESLLGFVGEGFDDFDAVDFFADFAEDGRLIAGAGADIECPATGFCLGKLGHEGDDVGLGDGLLVADGEGVVEVGVVTEVVWNEFVTGDLAHGPEDSFVVDISPRKIALDHSPASVGEFWGFPLEGHNEFDRRLPGGHSLRGGFAFLGPAG